MLIYLFEDVAKKYGAAAIESTSIIPSLPFKKIRYFYFITEYVDMLRPFIQNSAGAVRRSKILR